MQPRNIARYGWRPDLPDFRDLFYHDVHAPYSIVVSPDHVPEHTAEVLDTPTGKVVVPKKNTIVTTLPEAVSLRTVMPPVFNQGNLGSCTSNAAAALFAYVHGGGPYSRLQIYYDERVMEGTVAYDAGAQIKDSIQVLAKIGAGLEIDWPYDVSKFADAPPPKELQEAAQNKAIVYSRVVTGYDFRNCLAQGFPFIIGFTVYESMEGNEVATTGIVPMPSPNERIMGGHAVCVIGYSIIDGVLYYEVRNSWGDQWGDSGNFYIPAEYLENPNLACDGWTIRR